MLHEKAALYPATNAGIAPLEAGGSHSRHDSSVLTIVVCDERAAIYLDEVLVCEEDSLHPRMIAEASDGLPVRIRYIGYKHEVEEYIIENQGFPHRLSLLPIRAAWLM